MIWITRPISARLGQDPNKSGSESPLPFPKSLLLGESPNCLPASFPSLLSNRYFSPPCSQVQGMPSHKSSRTVHTVSQCFPGRSCRKREPERRKSHKLGMGKTSSLKRNILRVYSGQVPPLHTIEKPYPTGKPHSHPRKVTRLCTFENCHNQDSDPYSISPWPSSSRW